jgi:hypothetical protein
VLKEVAWKPPFPALAHLFKRETGIKVPFKKEDLGGSKTF